MNKPNYITNFFVLLGSAVILLSALSAKPQQPFPALVNQSTSFPHELAVLKTVEQLAFSDDWQQQTHQVVPQGGHAMIIIGVGNNYACGTLKISVPDAHVSVLLPTQLSTPSSISTPVGTYYDIIAPQNKVTCRLSAFRLIEWKPDKVGKVFISAGANKITVTISFGRKGPNVAKPFFVGLSNAFLIKGHCLTYCPREAELVQKYGSMLRHHHAIPIQNWVTVPPIKAGVLDLNYGQEKGVSFWLTGNGKQQFFVNFPRMWLYPNRQLYLQALEQTIQRNGLVGRAWVYVRDEPKNTVKLKQELMLYRRYAPSVLTMVTTPYRLELAGLIDIFSPNIAQWNPAEKGYDGKFIWPYASCMGSCGPNRAGKTSAPKIPGLNVNRPDFLIDRPAQRITEYFSNLSASGATGGLYYHAVEGYRLYRKGINVITDPWNFGGNGDGLLAYPGRPGELGLTEHRALPSFRLKLIRQAIERYW